MKKRILGDSFKDVIRHIWYFLYPFPALNGLDKKLLNYLPDCSGFFIEAGANDGIRQSNTYYLEKRRSWSGLLVEPVPRLALKCEKNRSRSTVAQVALVPPELSGSSIRILDLDLMTLVAEQESGLLDTAKHIKLAEDVQGITAAEISVPGITLSELLDTHGNPKITLFSLDVEGYEVDVLRGLDLTRHKPEFILVETRRLEKVLEVLENQYEMIAALSHHDYLFKSR